MSETHINEMKQVAQEISSLRNTETELKNRRKQLMQEAHDNGMTYQAIGDALGVTKAYVHQQIGKHRPAKIAEIPETPVSIAVVA
jgi:DNA-directed RNA polymerase specialized sigma subunit